LHYQRKYSLNNKYYFKLLFSAQQRKKKMGCYLYVVEGDKDSEEAIRVLETSQVVFKKICINMNENGKSMFRDLETTETPSLATPDHIYIGLENIIIFAKH
jgi:hypothetical protein